MSKSLITLPDRMLITGPDSKIAHDFLARLERSLQSGIVLVQLRAPGLSATAYMELATVVHKLCVDHQAELVLNPPVDGITPLLNVGWHFSSRHLMALHSRTLYTTGLIGASCHNVSELIQAGRLNLDYALLSPVLATATHPDAIPLGWDVFAALVKQVQIPVYALGGLDLTHIRIAKQHGAQGIAAIRGLWYNGKL